VLREIIMPLISEKSKPTNNKPAIQKVTSFCDRHPTEEANLFCFTCENKCLCV